MTSTQHVHNKIEAHLSTWRMGTPLSCHCYLRTPWPQKKCTTAYASVHTSTNITTLSASPETTKLATGRIANESPTPSASPAKKRAGRQRMRSNKTAPAKRCTAAYAANPRQPVTPATPHAAAPTAASEPRDHAHSSALSCCAGARARRCGARGMTVRLDRKYLNKFLDSTINGPLRFNCRHVRRLWHLCSR